MIYQIVSLDRRNFINRHKSFAEKDKATALEYISKELALDENFEVEIKKFDGELPGKK